MKVVIFGASGMIGQGLLRECLLDPGVERVLSVVRKPTAASHAKLTEIVHSDFSNHSAIESQLAGLDAGFFSVGVTSAGMNEADYRRITYGYTLAAAQTLARLNPSMTFIYVSAAGADSSEKGRLMWARVRGETENAVLRLPFRAAYVFRPAVVIPLHGIQSRTAWYRVLYKIIGWALPAIKLIAPGFVATTEQMGRAMLKTARHGAPRRILESRDIQHV